jgi:AraC family transcriptional regulator of adaptative response / DNA-3-methyladenine glycosylase II
LPTILPGAHTQARERPLLSHRGGGASSWISPVSPLSAGNVARARLLARKFQYRIPCARVDRSGGLDEANVDTLAARLGIGERQLRRLFRQHLGASPISIAQTRRILLAKQSIQDTRLPMTEVAAAAGFGSIRRFNEIFQQLYRRPPTALRRRGLADQSVGTTGAVSVRLGFRPPYDWDAIVSFLRARAIPGIEVVSSGRYVRTIAIGDQHGVLVVEPAERNCLKATVRFPALTHLPAIIARVRRVFDLAADPVAIGADLSRDPLLAPLVAAHPGLRVPGAWDGFELAVRAILGQQITVPAATRLVGKLVAFHGERIADPTALDLGLMRVFPTLGSLPPRTWRRSACRGPGAARCPHWRQPSSLIR